MRIARIEIDGAARAAIVSADGASAQVLPADVTVISLLGDDREVVAARAEREVALDEVRLLAPVEPPSIRDFSVFEQHIEGVVKNGNPDATIPEAWYASPFCYFSNPHADHRSRRRDRDPTRLREPRPRARGRCRHRPLWQEPAPRGGGRPHRRLHDLQRLVRARHPGGGGAARPFGTLKGKDFANTLGPWIVTPDELEPLPHGDRFDLDMRACVNGRELGDDTRREHGMELRGACRLRLPRHVGAAR